MALKRVSRSEAVDLVRHCLDEGLVQWGPHFVKALADEQLVMIDVTNVLRLGTIYEEPEQDIRTGDWKYRVEGHEPDGKWLCIAITFREEENVFLITVFSVESRRKK
jgi:hypothetical protein